MTPAQPQPASIPAALYTIALLVASIGGAGLALCGAWCATHPESGASIELARALMYGGIALAAVVAAVASRPWGRS